LKSKDVLQRNGLTKEEEKASRGGLVPRDSKVKGRQGWKKQNGKVKGNPRRSEERKNRDKSLGSTDCERDIKKYLPERRTYSPLRRRERTHRSRKRTTSGEEKISGKKKQVNSGT